MRGGAGGKLKTVFSASGLCGRKTNVSPSMHFGTAARRGQGAAAEMPLPRVDQTAPKDPRLSSLRQVNVRPERDTGNTNKQSTFSPSVFSGMEICTRPAPSGVCGRGSVHIKRRYGYNFVLIYNNFDGFRELGNSEHM